MAKSVVLIIVFEMTRSIKRLQVFPFMAAEMDCFVWESGVPLREEVEEECIGGGSGGGEMDGGDA